MTLSVEFTNNLNGQPLVLPETTIQLLAEWIVAEIERELEEGGGGPEIGAIHRTLEAAPLNT